MSSPRVRLDCAVLRIERAPGFREGQSSLPVPPGLYQAPRRRLHLHRSLRDQQGVPLYPPAPVAGGGQIDHIEVHRDGIAAHEFVGAVRRTQVEHIERAVSG